MDYKPFEEASGILGLLWGGKERQGSAETDRKGKAGIGFDGYPYGGYGWASASGGGESG